MVTASCIAKAAGAMLAAVCLAGAPQPARGCLYHEFGFDGEDKSQTDAEKLLAGHYAPTDRKAEREAYAKRLSGLRAQMPEKRDDADFLDLYAMALLRTGDYAAAEKIWNGLLEADPKRFVTLCNAGTALHQRQELEKAGELIGQAARLRPDFRGGAERWHARMIDFLQNQRRDNTYNKTHLFLDELTPVWTGRKGVEPLGDFPLEISSDGIAELIRQFPNFGDGWVVLGMALEKEGDLYPAALAYERALKFGTGQRERLEPFLAVFGEKARAADPARLARGSVIWAAASLLAVLLIFIAYRFGGAIWSDVKEAREAKKDGDKS